jgi:hypothetical protein
MGGKQKVESRKQKSRGMDAVSESSVEGLVEGGFEEAAGLGLDGGELGFEAVAEGHQFVHFGDDAVLFAQRRNRNGEEP